METIMNGNMVKFVDADLELTQLENLLQMADSVTYADFLIGGWELDKEYYIDERSYKNKKGFYVVKPIAENEKFFWYVCPYCQQIHIESKRILITDNPIIITNCPYRFRIIQYVKLDCVADPLALQEDVPDSVIKAEWEYMKAYLEAKASLEKRW